MKNVGIPQTLTRVSRASVKWRLGRAADTLHDDGALELGSGDRVVEKAAFAFVVLSHRVRPDDDHDVEFPFFA